MSNFGIDSETGFNLKRLNDIIESVKALLLQVQDPDSGEYLQVDFDEDDPFINFINIMNDLISTGWELNEISYGQFNPQLAAGPSLSGLVQLNGITRKQGSPSSAVIQLTGSPGLRVPSGTQVSDANREVIWEFTADIYLDSVTGLASATAYSVENGAFNYTTGQINLIVTTSLPGLTSIVNTADSIPGTADESNEALRLRRNDSTTTPAQSIPEAIYASVLNLEGVTLVRVYVNKTLVTDGNGIPAKRIAVVVQGGDNDEIAAAIFVRVGVAVDTYGNTFVTFPDQLQQSNTIYFVRPVEVPIYVDIDITIIDASTFPANGVDLIKSNIVAYSVGGASALGITDVETFDQTGFQPGEDVVVSRLFTPINAVPGLKINSVEIGINPSTFSTADISIDWDEVSKFETGNIGVTIT